MSFKIEDTKFNNAFNGFDIISDKLDKTVTFKLTNPNKLELKAKEITLVDIKMPFAKDTYVYGEGYNKLCQYSGTVENFQMVGSYGDYEHYKLPKPDRYNQAYNMIVFSPTNEKSFLFGFSSCNRFTSKFHFNEERFKIVLDLEGIMIKGNETIQLEELYFECGEKNEILTNFARQINKNHPMLEFSEIPTGWCSWLVYGPNITSENIIDNLNAIKKNNLLLKYVQIDDGYQPYMGDWLDSTDLFSDGVSKVCLQIKEKGFEPAMWLAPFIAEKESKLFREHPDWFVMTEENGTLSPLASNKISFGGWRCAPWYMLDTTHPEARKYLTEVFRVMRNEWDVKYFKLDANMWGAFPFGIRYEKNKTCVEAYRMGMQAILEGAGCDSFILGCNAPMWPSLGLVHGMRVTNDNLRRWKSFKMMAQECFPRNWQHNNLWINDPDTVLFLNKDTGILDVAGNEIKNKDFLTENEFIFNASYVLASGGMILSGDDITKFTDEHSEKIKKLIPPIGKAAVFKDEKYEIGEIINENNKIIFIFNYDDIEKVYQTSLVSNLMVTDFWTDELVGNYKCLTLQPHSAKVLLVSL